MPEMEETIWPSKAMNQNTVTRELLDACQQADWGQVLANGGPPCFHLMDEGTLCLRAERWQGHGVKGFHDYKPLHALIHELLEANALLKSKLATATETWFDDETTWAVPTAWAYAQACKIVNGRQLTAEREREELRSQKAVLESRLADARRVLGIVAPYHEDCYCDEDDGLSGKCVHCVIIDAAGALRAKPDAWKPSDPVWPPK